MNAPLAERLRPKTLDEYLSQEHLVGSKGALTTSIKKGIIPSIILWGLRAWVKPLWPLLLQKNRSVLLYAERH